MPVGWVGGDTKRGERLGWVKEAERLKFDEGKSWRDTAMAVSKYFPELSREQVFNKVRDSLRRSKRYTGRKKMHKSTFTMKGDTFTYEDTQELIGNREITPEVIMEAHNLKSDEWEVISFTSNVWQQQTANGGKIDLCQTKLTVKPLIKTGITFDDIDNYFNQQDYKFIRPLKPFEYSDSKEILEIDLVDLHIGLLSWRKETGQDFDLDIVENNFYECLADIIRRCKTNC